MLSQLSDSFLVATRLDAWEQKNIHPKASVPENLRNDLGLAGEDCVFLDRPARKMIAWPRLLRRAR